MDIVRQYFDAWNRRDPAGIVATMTEEGIYTDPVVSQGVTGQALADYAGGLFAGFPDLSFEIVSFAATGNNTIAAQWLMRGTNSGSYLGLPPTGKIVALPGADFIEVDGDKICSVTGYFDTRAMPQQLGLQVLVQPRTLGPVSFGYSVHMPSGKRTKPGAFSLTALQLHSDQEANELRGYSRRIMPEMARMPGFISFLAAGVNNWFFTVTAWENPDNPKQIFQDGAHKEAMQRFYGPGFAVGGATSVWTPARINPMWVRCPACNSMANYDRLEGQCQCGEALTTPPAYW